MQLIGCYQVEHPRFLAQIIRCNETDWEPLPKLQKMKRKKRNTVFYFLALEETSLKKKNKYVPSRFVFR